MSTNYFCNFIRRNFRTAKKLFSEISRGEIFLLQNFLAVKFPYGKISHCEI